MMLRRRVLTFVLATATIGCPPGQGRAPRANEYLGLPRNAEEIALAHARTFADSARGRRFGLPPVTAREMRVERGATARRRAAAALGVASDSEFVVVRLGRAAYLAYRREGFGRAGEFSCSYALLDERLTVPRRLCG